MRLIRFLPLVLVLLGVVVPAGADVGVFLRYDCAAIASPVTDQTWCVDMTTRSIKVWNGSAYVLAVGSNGILPGVSGGTGLNTTGSTGTARVDAGSWAITDLKATGYATASLPAAGTAGRINRLTDGGAVGALVIDDGTNWNCDAAKSLKVVVVTCPPYNATGTGTTDDRTALNSANTAAGTTGTLVFPKGTYKVSSALTLSAAVRMLNGAILSPDTGVTVTLSNTLIAGSYKVFTTGAGTISFAGAAIERILPQWWGAVANDTATDSRAALQAAINASVGAGQYAPSGGRSIVFLSSGRYKVSGPVLVTASATRIMGETRSDTAGTGTHIATDSTSFFPILYYLSPTARTDLRYTTSLVTGAGSGLEIRGATNDTYLDFQEALTRTAFNGLSTFCAELFFKMTSSGGAVARHLLSSKGKRAPGEGVRQTFNLEAWTDGSLHAALNVGGTAFAINTGAGVFALNTVYHLALTYDGTTIRLFLNGTLIGSNVQAGTISQKSYDNGSIGAYREVFPFGGVWTSGIDGVMDSIRISNATRYTANFTAPTAKLANDANTLVLLNFDNEDTDFSKVATLHGTHWLLKHYPTAPHIPYQELSHLAIHGSYSYGIVALGTPWSHFHDLDVAGHIGIALIKDSFLSTITRVKVTAAVTGRIGIFAGGGSGINTYRQLETQSFDYGMILQDGGGDIDNVYISGPRYIGILLTATENTLHLNAIASSTEGVTDPKYEAAILVSGGKRVSITNSTIEGVGFALSQIWVDAPAVLSLENINFPMETGTSEVVRIIAQPTAGSQLVEVHNLSVVPTTIPISTSPIRDRSGRRLSNTAAYAAVANTVAETYFALAGDGKLTAGALNGPKRRVECQFAGVYSTTLTPTLQVKAKLCTVSGCGSGTVTTIADSGAVPMPASVTDQGWTARLATNVFTAGTSGTLDTQGEIQFGGAVGSVTHSQMANTATQTVNTTVDQFLSVSATWSAASASNTVTLRNLGCEAS